MTRWGMVVDLNRCVGCQTCTAACKHANATAPGVQWRRVLDIEAGTFPEVRRAFVPVGCMHCQDPPCVDVCPSTATRRREDGLVTIDYDLCIGCSYCFVACPYQARYKVEQPRYAYAAGRMAHEAVREDPRRIGVAQKCTFCIGRVDAGRAQGLVPGVAPAATPACAVSCIAGALHFGDLDDPQSNVSGLIGTHSHFVMHEELGTRPGLYYLYDGKRGDPPDPSGGVPLATAAMGEFGVAPWHQESWDWRAAANFMAGGTGAGLFAAGAVLALLGVPAPALPIVALALVAAGLCCVWLEIGRPWRFLNVFLHPHTSWMTREALAALPLVALAFMTMLTGPPLRTPLALAAGIAAITFLYCQARILQAAKGIPAWREPAIVPLVIGSGFAEGLGLLFVVSGLPASQLPALPSAATALAALLAARLVLWRRYRGALAARGAPAHTVAVLDGLAPGFEVAGHLVPIGLAVAGLIVPAMAAAAFALAGLLAFASGWALKFVIVTRAAFNQGFAIAHMPARGAGTSAPGVRPGWTPAGNRMQL